MEDDFDPPWWHSPKYVVFLILGLVALSAIVMGLFVFVSQLFDGSKASKTPVYINYEAPQDKNSRTHVAKPYDPLPWPNRPDEPAGLDDRDGKKKGNNESASTPSGTSSNASRSTYNGPVGVSAAEFEAAAAAGKKMFIPDAKGNCDLGNTSSRDLINCFAARVAR